MRALRVGWGVFLATALLLATGERARAAETPAEWLAKVTTALEKGSVQEVSNLFDERAHKGIIEKVAGDLDLATGLVKAVYKHAPRLSLDSLQTARELVFVAGEVAKTMVFKSASDPRSRRATAMAHAAKARLLVVRSEPPEFESWLAAADQAALSYEGEDGAKDGGEAAVAAIGWMREASVLPGADAAAITAKVDALGAVLARLPDGPFPAVGKATVKLMALEATLRATPPPAPPTLKAPIDEITAILAPHARVGGDLTASTLWQECVTIVRSRKVGSMKIDYLLRPPAPGLNLTWQLPLSARWHDVPVVPGEELTFTGTLEQRMDDGRVVHRIKVETFRWDKRYQVGQALPFKGDSPKELALAVRDAQRALFATVTSEKDLTKGTMSDGMGPGQSYEIEGTSNANGEPIAVRGFVVRGRETKGTFMISTTTFGKPPPGDPELEAVIKSFREVKGGK